MTDYKWIGPAQFIIYAAILLLSTGIAYATIQQRLTVVEKGVETLESNHERMISIMEKIKIIERDLSEIKVDVKDLKKSLETHVLSNANSR